MRMRRTRAAVVAAFLLLPLAPSHGVETPTPSPSPSPSIFRTPMEQYKYEKDLYLLELKSYNIKVQQINQNFKIAIDKANFDYRNSRDKFSAKTVLRSATATAIALRDEAISELGEKPTPPVEPAKGSRLAPTKETKRPRK
ncbi:MAG: hypothetical protein F2578_02500 [Actinobacteria bacterium]|nr:hypothetical protein [Actinomycetota bacterium]